jgi:hypothetical protein
MGKKEESLFKNGIPFHKLNSIVYENEKELLEIAHEYIFKKVLWYRPLYSDNKKIEVFSFTAEEYANSKITCVIIYYMKKSYCEYTFQKDLTLNIIGFDCVPTIRKSLLDILQELETFAKHVGAKQIRIHGKKYDDVTLHVKLQENHYDVVDFGYSKYLCM